MIIQVHHWYNNIVRDIFAALDSVVLRLLAYIIRLIFRIGFFSPSSLTDLGNIYSKVYVVLTIYMLFKLSFTFLNYIINPEALSDNKQGVAKIIRNSIIMIILLIILPSIFSGKIFGSEEGNLITRIQKAAVPLITQILLTNDKDYKIENGIIDYGNASEDKEVEDNEDYLPNKIALSVLKVFFHPAEETYEHVCRKNGKTAEERMKNDKVLPIESIDDFKNLKNETCRKKNEDTIGKKYSDKNFYKYTYVYFISTIVIGFIDYMLIRIAILVGKRTFKLIVLEIIFPIPVIMLIDPKAMEASDSPFNTWLHSFISTFLELFFQLGVLFLFLTLISMLIEEFNTNSAAYKGFSGLLLQLALIISLVAFAGEAPSFVKKSLGVKEEKSPTDELATIIGAAVGINEKGKIDGGVMGAVTGEGKKVLGKARKGAEVAGKIAVGGIAGGVAGAVGGGIAAARNKKDGQDDSVGSGIVNGLKYGAKDGAGLDPDKSVKENVESAVKDEFDKTSAGKAYNAEVERIKANAKKEEERQQKERETMYKTAVDEAVNNDSVSLLAEINGDDKNATKSKVARGEESIRNYAEGQAAKGREELGVVNDKLDKAKSNLESAKNNKNKKDQKKYEDEVKQYEKDKARIEEKIKVNSDAANALKNKRDTLASDAAKNLDTKSVADYNNDTGPSEGQSIEEYANEKAEAAKARIDKATTARDDAEKNYQLAKTNGDTEMAANYAAEVAKQQSIIDEQKEIYDTNKSVAELSFEDELRKGNVDNLVRFNGETETVAAEKIKSGELTAQSYAAGKAEQARVEVELAKEKMAEAKATEKEALERKDTKAAMVAREEYDKQIAIRDEAQHKYDINKGFANTVDNNQRQLAESASNGNKQDLIDLNGSITGIASPTVDSLSNPDIVITYTNAQINSYDTSIAGAKASYDEAVDKVRSASSVEEATKYAVQAEQYETQITELSRKRDANKTVHLAAVAEKAANGDVDALMEITGADEATKAKVTSSKEALVDYTKSQVSGYMSEKQNLTEKKQHLESYLQSQHASLTEAELKTVKEDLEKTNTQLKQTSTKMKATQKAFSKLKGY